MTANQNPEQKASDHIDVLLSQAGWSVQHNKKIDLNTGLGQAVREYQTDVGPADYVLFVAKKAVGVIEAKRAEQGHNITAVEEQTEAYAVAKASQPLITKPTVPLKDLAMSVMMGASDEDTVSSLAGRLARLNKQLSARRFCLFFA